MPWPTPTGNARHGVEEPPLEVLPAALPLRFLALCTVLDADLFFQMPPYLQRFVKRSRCVHTARPRQARRQRGLPLGALACRTH